MSHPKVIYSDINEKIKYGKYKGISILTVVTKMSRTYMRTAIRNGKVIVTPELKVRITEEQAKFSQRKMSREHTKSETLNAHYTIQKKIIEKAKIDAKETNEPCIHNRCWCASKCKHHGRKTCDWQTQVEEGIKEIKERTFKYNIQI